MAQSRKPASIEEIVRERASAQIIDIAAYVCNEMEEQVKVLRGRIERSQARAVEINATDRSEQKAVAEQKTSARAIQSNMDQMAETLRVATYAIRVAADQVCETDILPGRTT